MKYIAYGSNMVEEQMAFRCPDATLIGTGYIQGARLEFYLHATVERSRIKGDRSPASNRRSTGTRVPVAVWEISKDDEQRLDRYEGFPDYYIKEVWRVHMDDGSIIEGMMYRMRLLRTAPPTVNYYNGIYSAYKKLGFASEIKTVLNPALERSLKRERR